MSFLKIETYYFVTIIVFIFSGKSFKKYIGSKLISQNGSIVVNMLIFLLFINFVSKVEVFGLGSRIGDMEVAGLKNHNFYPNVFQIWLDLLRVFWGCRATFMKHFLQEIKSFMPFLASEGCFWPLAASMRSEVKKIYAHVKP